MPRTTDLGSSRCLITRGLQSCGECFLRWDRVPCGSGTSDPQLVERSGEHIRPGSFRRYPMLFQLVLVDLEKATYSTHGAVGWYLR